MWETLAAGRVWRGPLHNKKKNGELFVENAIIAPVADEAGHVTHYVALKEDITERQRTAAALADDLPAFDALLAKYRDQKTDDVAQILFMQAALYAQVLEEPARARELFVRLKADFPATKPGAEADRYLAALDQAIEAAQAKAKLVGSPAPELTFNWSSRA
eukprot:gene45863-biopygen31727